MRERRTVTMLALVAAAALPGAGTAQAQLAIGGGGGGEGELVGATFLPTTVEGRLAVDFSANPGTGCAAPCDLQGRVVWTPARDAMITILETRTRSGVEPDVSLDFDDFAGERPATAAEVTRAASSGTPGHCQDARVERYGSLDFNSDPPGTVLARLASPTRSVSYGPDLLATRCGGPREADVAAVLPTRSLPIDALRRGTTTIDLSTTAQFASGGMAGTVRSSIVLRVKRPEVDGESLGQLPRELIRAIKWKRLRLVEAVYAVERFSGDVVTAFDGSAQPDLCRPVDSCGMHGSIKLTHAVTKGEASVVAIGPARLSRRRLGAALGLYAGRPNASVATSGVVTWDEDPGRAASTVTDVAGRSCSDSTSLGGGLIDLSFSRTRVTAGYGAAGLFDGDPLRSRCAGPGFADASDGSAPVARGFVSRRAFRKRRVTLTLDRGSAFESGAYSGKVQPALTLTLRRVRIESSTLRVPSFGGFRAFGR